MFSNNAITQNLVPNPGFEFYNACPYECDVGSGPMACEPWISNSSCNYFNPCAPGPCGMPYNFQGFQMPHGGDAYAGGYQKTQSGIPERLQILLTEPLLPGHCYDVSYWANLSNLSCGMNRLGALFTEDYNIWPIPTPQIDTYQEWYNDTVNWFQVSGSFVASGGEQVLTIGNFYPSAETQWEPGCPGPFIWSYYYFDDVSVTQAPSFPLDVDIGGPYTACTILTLDAGIPDASYYWSTGDTSQTVNVTESGIYSVTVALPGCIVGSAETEVTILGVPAVYIGPDIELCPGDTYTIHLNEFAGDYLWNDGSTDFEYTITEPGIYSVTLDDGCDITTDAIFVAPQVAPDIFLGPDQTLCDGESVLLEIDPGMGTFVWQDNSTGNSFLAFDPGTYAVTVTNACGMDADEIEIIALASPDISLGPDTQTICANENILLQLDENIGVFTWQDGSHEPFFNVDTAGVYSVFVFNVCGVDSDSILVTGIPTPVVDLGNDVLLCPGQTLVLSAGNNVGDIQWQDGMTGNEYEVLTGGAYAVTVTNECGSSSDLVIVDFEPAIIQPNLGPDITVCTGDSIVLQVKDPNASILWNDQSTGNTLTVFNSGVYSVQLTSVCESYADTVEIVIEDNPPDVSLPNDFAICEGQSTVLDAGIPNVNYLWNDSSQLSQFTVTIPGIYSVTVSSACGTDTDSVEILNGGPAPMVSLGADTAICEGSVFVLNPAYQSVNAWIWPDGSDTSYYMVSGPGSIYVQASNNCGNAFDTMNIDLLPEIPTFSLGVDTAICPGDSILLSISIPGVAILWSDGSINDSIIIPGAANVVATVSNGCNSRSDTIVVNQLPGIPLLDLGADQTFCPGEIVTVNPGIPNVSYVWQDGSTATQYQASGAGLISLTISNACGSSSDTIQLNESTNGPQLDLGPDQQACEEDTILIDAGILGVTYTWQDGSTGNHFLAFETGTYSLTVHNACGVDHDTINILIDGTAPETFLGPDTSLCIGSEWQLSVSSSPGTMNLWQDGTNANSILINTPGQYYLTQTNVCGADSDTIQITIDSDAPETILPPDTLLCVGSTFMLTAIPDMGTTNLWQDGSPGHHYLVTSTGIYHLTQTNKCGVDNDSILVDISKQAPVANLGQDTTLCEGESFNLISNTGTGDFIRWQDGSSLSLFTVVQPGTYSLHVSNECGESMDDIRINYLEMPAEFELGNDTTLCPNATLVLQAPVTGDEIEWQDGSNSTTFQVEQEGIYALTVRNICGSAFDEIHVDVDNDVPDFGEDHFVLCAGDEIVLDASQAFSAGYTWNTGVDMPAIVIITPGVYAVTVITLCREDSHEIEVTPDTDCDEGEIFIPNIISPNNDNINDVFTMHPTVAIELMASSGTIYDRWGNQVFVSNEIPFRWNGTFGDKDVMPGVYIYKVDLTYKLRNREIRQILTGDVTVIR